MKPSLQLRLSQNLALTPQLQQSIKLLQLSTVEMQQEIENYLQENPMLERDDDGAFESFSSAQQFDAPRSDAVERADHEEREERDLRDDREHAIPTTPPTSMTTAGRRMPALLPEPVAMTTMRAMTRISRGVHPVCGTI